MTTALKNILSKLDTLPVHEQNAIAGLLKQEMEWQKSFEQSQEQLSMLAAEALSEYRKGKTQSMKLK